MCGKIIEIRKKVSSSSMHQCINISDVVMVKMTIKHYFVRCATHGA